LKKVVEALIFASDGPIALTTIAKILENTNGVDLQQVVQDLNDDYTHSGHSLQIVEVAGGVQITTQPQYASWVKKLYQGRTSQRLSHAALEALAIIAFKQPISKVEISAIRGVNSDGVVKNLLERRLITISGRGEGVGRPLLYSTTPQFLQYFGINEISDLPRPREIQELFGDSKYADYIIEALSETDEPEAPAVPEGAQGDDEGGEANE